MEEEFSELTERPSTGPAWFWIGTTALSFTVFYLVANDPEGRPKATHGLAKLGEKVIPSIANLLGTKGSLALGIIFVSIGLVMLWRAKGQQKEFDEQRERSEQIWRRQQEKNKSS